MTSSRCLSTSLLALGFPCLSIAAESAPRSDIHAAPSISPLSNIGGNAITSISGRNALLHAAAFLSTYVLVRHGVDAEVEQYFHDRPVFGNLSFPVAPAGMIVPVAVIGGLYYVGKRDSEAKTLAASYAVLQSTALTLAYVSVLKGITGRPHPDPGSPEPMADQSRRFRFGFLRGGMFWGWPSGHAAVMTAVATTLTTFYPEKDWLNLGALGTVAYTLVGVSSVGAGSMHWFSDAVAGTLMGYAVGSTVGRYYRRLADGEDRATEPSGMTVVPLMGPGLSGVAVRVCLRSGRSAAGQ